ncbi:hypothetical protein [Rhodopila sp.]|uniref:hypothetical protein n=1 Tax=Rhodopila sp. TaxID=2480087 RepID=UPI003D09B005
MLSLASCGTAPIVFDHANLASVRRMDVLTPGFPEQPTVAVLPPTNGALFLLVNAVQEGNRSREFAKSLVHAKSDPEAAFSKALVACLRDAGVQPSALPADVRRTSLLKQYGSVGAQGADAVLDVVVTRYGYYAVTNAAPFKPDIVMQARLVDIRSHRVLMQDTINMVNVISADPTVTAASFQDYSDIAANSDGAARTLQSAMGSAASAVCKRLT